jgi:aryl-alcohol dehydrogenase-like predicted oxidoreductase
MSHIGLGTAALGRPQYINIRKKETTPFSYDQFWQQSWAVLDEAYRQGIRYFDTAPGYGMSEKLLIDWFNSKKDYNIELATKWGYTYIANFDPDAIQHEIKDHSLSKLNEQWEQSKKLLPLLSTYQIHSATRDSGVLENEEVLNRMAELKEERKIFMGISTSGDDQVDIIKKALDIEIQGVRIFDTFQVTYNMLDQGLMEVADELKKRKKRIVIKEALANGRVFPNDNYPNYSKLYNCLNRLAEKYTVGVDAIALRFCIDTVQPFRVLSGAGTKSHIVDNLKALTIKLEEEELLELQSFKQNATEYWAERKQLTWN